MRNQLTLWLAIIAFTSFSLYFGAPRLIGLYASGRSWGVTYTIIQASGALGLLCAIVLATIWAWPHAAGDSQSKQADL